MLKRDVFNQGAVKILHNESILNCQKNATDQIKSSEVPWLAYELTKEL